METSIELTLYSLMATLSSHIASAEMRKIVTRKKRVLLTEDNTDLIDIMEKLLRRYFPDIEIEKANNGCEALCKMVPDCPDLLITDCEMPLMNGWELLERISAAPNLFQPKVLAISGNPLLLQRMLTLGANAVLSKPFDWREFIQLVYELLGENVKPKRFRKAC